ncbi:hypothetical protein JRO89_XS03G0208700 [Xanthoceras sorbifolium]|uniref:DUF7081 domain-containing protein n=1 Tax=Xanthoceras sorbifolium TaxID=99658 RepID=A0ABQ8IAX0_9ROSI|nr:hypothetical protein JRO89_XS03G0208700 [Xanthoceras sorbifolium]
MNVDGSRNGIHLTPVLPDASGRGLPYAPMNWPNPGDNWSWRVGRRVASTGHYLDRYLYLPKHLPRLESSKSRKGGFASKLSVERYIRTTFPDANVDAFFASFSWKIPAKQLSVNGPETEKVEDGKEEKTTTVKRRIKHTVALSSVKRQTWRSRRQSIIDAGDTIDSHSPNKEEAASESPGKDMKNTTDFDDDLFSGKNFPGEHISKEFDSYLDSPVDSLAQHLFEAPLPQENELGAAKMLKEKKVKLTSLRREYNELKEKATLLQIEIDSNLLSVQGIHDQIAQLQSRQAEIMSLIETKKKTKFELTINQKKLAGAIQRIAHEFQLNTQESQNVG